MSTSNTTPYVTVTVVVGGGESSVVTTGSAQDASADLLLRPVPLPLEELQAGASHSGESPSPEPQPLGLLSTEAAAQPPSPDPAVGARAPKVEPPEPESLDRLPASGSPRAAGPPEPQEVSPTDPPAKNDGG